ncbi:MAG: FAD-dependent oxidoreductase [Anaerolineales bacterium]|nr:FAD-dependent oxidoreductase [Anaerolineales bacterium]
MGADLVEQFATRVATGLEHHLQDTVDLVERTPQRHFKLHLHEGHSIEARAVIMATGVRAQRLFVDGESEFFLRGLSYSAISHAPLFAGRDVAIIAGGDRAVAAARILAPLANHIYYIIARPQRIGDLEAAEETLSDPKISVFRGWEMQQVVGDAFVTGIDLVGISGEVRHVPVDGVFVQFGLLPNNGAVRNLVQLDADGHIIVDENCATSTPGLFAAGDVTTVCAEQFVVSLGEGAKAALAAWRYLAEPGA